MTIAHNPRVAPAQRRILAFSSRRFGATAPPHPLLNTDGPRGRYIAAYVWTGSPGGLFTPSLTIGALLAGILGYGWLHLFPGARIGSYAIIGGGAFLAAAMQGPLSGVVLVLVLTRNFDSLMAPTLIAVAEATIIARRLGVPSIYSARLRPDPDDLSTRSAGTAAISALERAGALPGEDPAEADADRSR